MKYVTCRYVYNVIKLYYISNIFTAVSMGYAKDETRCYECQVSCVSTCIYVKRVLVQLYKLVTLYIYVDYSHVNGCWIWHRVTVLVINVVIICLFLLLLLLSVCLYFTGVLNIVRLYKSLSRTTPSQCTGLSQTS